MIAAIVLNLQRPAVAPAAVEDSGGVYHGDKSAKKKLLPGGYVYDLRVPEVAAEVIDIAAIQAQAEHDAQALAAQEIARISLVAQASARTAPQVQAIVAEVAQISAPDAQAGQAARNRNRVAMLTALLMAVD